MIRHLCPLLALATTLPAQDVVARFVLEDEPATVSAEELAVELGRRYGRTDQGVAAREFMIQLELVRGAAEADGLMPTSTETMTWIAQLEQRLQQAGTSLDAMMAQKGMTRAQFEPFAAIQLAQERLVRAELELEPHEPIPPGTMELWLSDAREAQSVEVRPERLRAGVVARIGNREITETALGHTLASTTDPQSRQKFIRQIVLRRCIEARAKARGISVSDAEMQQEVAARKAEANSNPQYKGVPFEQLLATQGTSIEELLKSPVLRAQVLERKLLQELLPDEELERELEQDPDAVMRRHGARRRLSLLLVSTVEGEQQARARVEQIRERIEREMPFAEAARTYSDDPQGRISGGDAGWHHADGSALPAAVVEAAFANEVGALSQPIETEFGYFLVRVAGVEPEPPTMQILHRMRQAAAADARTRMLEDAKVEFIGGGS